MDCNGDELVVLQCERGSSISSLECYRHNFDVTVSCCKIYVNYHACLILSIFFIDTTRIWDFPFNGMVRLRDGEFVNEGRVEVYCNGEWGTVCDNGGVAGLTGIDVFCRQLGYDDARLEFGRAL